MQTATDDRRAVTLAAAQAETARLNAHRNLLHQTRREQLKAELAKSLSRRPPQLPEQPTKQKRK